MLNIIDAVGPVNFWAIDWNEKLYHLTGQMELCSFLLYS